jgi:hypothetical protein
MTKYLHASVVMSHYTILATGGKETGAGVSRLFEEGGCEQAKFRLWEFGRGALSANLNFFDNHSLGTGAGANPVLG